MTDADLIQLFLPIIQAGLIADGFTGVTVKQSNQPTQQGANTAPTVYFYKVANKRYGFPRWSDDWDADTETMVHTEEQVFETTFSVNALVISNPATPLAYTASDLVNEVAAILQSYNTCAILQESFVGIERISDISNPYWVDDRDQFEASPSFNFVLTYSNSRITVAPVVESVDYDIQRV